jgi:predicted Zn finger-like uncharacterized protein
MIVTCPECSTRYAVDPASIGEGGRRVRCIKCSHTWLQAPPDDLPRPVAPESAPLAAPEEEYLQRRAARRPPPRHAAQRRRKSSGGAWVAWLILLIVVGGVAGGGYMFQKEIERIWPPAAHLYALVGLVPDPPGFGLDLRNVKSKEIADGARRVLQVEGQIVNTTDKVRDVPALKGVLLDQGERELQHWVFRARENRLLPGEAVTFQSEIVDPSPDAARLTIIFDDKT